MPKQKTDDFGLEITNNSKAGPAFSLPRSKTCIHKTSVCWRVCYGRGIRYQSDTQRNKRERNFRTVEFLLDRGGPQLLAENLVLLVDQARPIDWIAARITGRPTGIPWTVRVHDVGDYHSINYALAWLITFQMRPQCSFWFYTRSFLEDELFDTLCELAAQPNCKAWLSLDSENYDKGIIRYCNAKPGLWQIALLQEEADDMPSELLPALSQATRPGEIVSFPKHHGGRHVEPLKGDNITVCPQVLGAYPLQPNPNQPRPCQSCAFCLP